MAEARPEPRLTTLAAALAATQLANNRTAADQRSDQRKWVGREDLNPRPPARHTQFIAPWPFADVR